MKTVCAVGSGLLATVIGIAWIVVCTLLLGFFLWLFSLHWPHWPTWMNVLMWLAFTVVFPMQIYSIAKVLYPKCRSYWDSTER